MTKGPETKPAADFRNAPLFLLSQLQRATRAEWDARLAEYGLSIADYSAMSVVDTLGAATNAELARRSYVTAQTMYRVVSGLMTRGLFETGEPTLTRGQPVRLSQPGRNMLGELRSRQHVIIERMSGGDKAALAQFLALLKRFNANLIE